MSASKFTHIPLEIEDTRKPPVQKAIIRKNPIPMPQEGQELSLGPILSLLFEHLMIGLNKSLVLVKHQLIHLSKYFPKLKSLPWLRIGVLALTAFVLFKKDMRFNMALKAPLSKVADDQNDVKNARSVAQTVAYRPNASAKNAYAPVGVSDLQTQRTRDFIREYAPLAIEEMHKTGIPASIKIAQALIESRAGSSRLAKNNNNFFGIKCFSKNCKKGHCTNATDDHHKDFFRKYNSSKASWSHHSQILTTGRYKKLKKHGKNYKKWAKGLKSAGYATDKTYDKKLISVIQKYQLNKLDKR